MAHYRIHRIKDGPREAFRWTAHTGGIAIIKPKDYDFSEEIESPTPYAAWKTLASEGRPLRPGDVLETLGTGSLPAELKIAKYIGFEPAQWWIPEPKPDSNTTATGWAESVPLVQESHP